MNMARSAAARLRKKKKREQKDERESFYLCKFWKSEFVKEEEGSSRYLKKEYSSRISRGMKYSPRSKNLLGPICQNPNQRNL